MNETILLDGAWEFGFKTIALEKVTAGNIPATTLMTVPGCFDVKPPLFSQWGTGFYKRSVRCGGKVLLRIAAMGLRGQVFWDGKKLGDILELPFSPEEIVFDAGKEGEHILGIAVENTPHDRSEGKMYAADYDFYCHGGIYDSVSIRQLPEYWIQHLEVTPLDHKTKKVKVRLVLTGEVKKSTAIEYAFNGGPMVKKTVKGKELVWEETLKDAQLWTPENPVLQTLTVKTPCDEKEVTFGMRTIAVKNASILLNGKPLLLVGYNRHDSHPDFGYALPESTMLYDLQLMKRQKANFIRGCHYPQREKFLDLCDRMGFLVWEEVIGWGNQAVHFTNKDFHRRQLEQAAIMVHKSMNHPSVIMWGFLNEVYMPKGNSPRPLIRDLVETLHKEDPSRPTTFAFATSWRKLSDDDCLDLVDILSFNTYPGWYTSFEKANAICDIEPELRDLAKYANRKDLKNKPLIIGEIGAPGIIGDHSGARWSEDYQADLIETVMREFFRNKRYTGVALWQYCNIRTYITDGFLTRPRGFNNKGLVDEYRNPKLAWHRVTKLLEEYKFDGYEK